MDAIDWLHYPHDDRCRMMFADPPDAMGLKYKGFKDEITDDSYERMLITLLNRGSTLFDVMWLSLNVKWTAMIGHVTYEWQKSGRTGSSSRASRRLPSASTTTRTSETTIGSCTDTRRSVRSVTWTPCGCHHGDS
jgi:hypothetical protein